MLRPKKKITKRELKEDALVKSYVKATTFYEEHKKNIKVATTVIVVRAIAAVVYTNNQRTNEARAAVELGKVYSYYDNNQFRIAVDGIPERNIPGLKSIVENYGSTHSGNFARFYLANAYFQLREYDQALEHFEDFSPDGQLLTVSRLAGIAACYEGKGEHEKAAQHYEKASTSYPKDIEAAAHLNLAALNYSLAGQKEKAIELFQRLKKEFPTTSYGRDADRFILQLSV